MKLIFFFSTLLAAILINVSANGQALQLKESYVVLGNDTVIVQKYDSPLGANGYCLIHVHENETASLEAGFRMLLKYGGSLVTLRHSLPGLVNRNIQFTIQKDLFEFDPNRIFSKDTSILNKTLSSKSNTPAIRDSALKVVQNVADVILKEIEPFPNWVALHNNKNTPAKWAVSGREVEFEAESYSLVSYVKKFDEASESSLSASDIYINPVINNSEFFIVTSLMDFDAIQKKRFNVVLQNENPVDDGSLSVYAFSKGKRYINSEAKHGKVDEQFGMLELLHQVLTENKF
ncbi:MAG TPA: hypothetical protein PKA12_06975 [Saprospiraceae bacterium]|nr:hypothetical protein [Saprospiraceae bacterium]